MGKKVKFVAASENKESTLIYYAVASGEKMLYWTLRGSTGGHTHRITWGPLPSSSEVWLDLTILSHKDIKFCTCEVCLYFDSFLIPTGSGNQRDVSRQQKDWQPSENAHHLQQRQRLEVTSGPEQRPKRKQHPLRSREFSETRADFCTCFFLFSLNMRPLPSKRGLDRSWLIPAAMRGRAQKEHRPSKLERSEACWAWKVSHFWFSPISRPPHLRIAHIEGEGEGERKKVSGKKAITSVFSSWKPLKVWWVFLREVDWNISKLTVQLWIISTADVPFCWSDVAPSIS